MRNFYLLLVLAALTFGGCECPKNTNPLGASDPAPAATPTPTVPVNITINTVIGAALTVTIDGTSVTGVGPTAAGYANTCGANYSQVYSVQSGTHQVQVTTVYSSYNWSFPGGVTYQNVTVNALATGLHGVNVACNGTTGPLINALATAF